MFLYIAVMEATRLFALKITEFIFKNHIIAMQNIILLRKDVYQRNFG
jgi:hypothetical protein